MIICERIYRQDKRAGKNFGKTKTNFQTAHRRFDKSLKCKKRSFYKGKLLQLETLNSKNPNEFWNYIKNLGPRKVNKIPWAVEIEGDTVTDHKLVLEKWKSDFENLYAVNENGFDDTFMKEVQKENSATAQSFIDFNLLNKDIEYEEVKRAIDRAKNQKAVGIDMIPNELLKNNTVIELLYKLFSMCFKNELIPDQWWYNIIHPIPKTNIMSIDPLKYRGLALQSCIFKILSDVISVRVVKYLEHHQILADEQNGFRRGRSCLHHVFALNTVVKNRMAQNKPTFCAFVDFRKAFDVVNRELLYHRLAKYGITGTVLNIIKHMYTSTVNLIRLNGEYSERFESKKGILQGNNLSPTLFSVYINDLIAEMKSKKLGVKLAGSEKLINILAYADDLVLIGETAAELNEMLETLKVWCKRWRVLINMQKTKAMHFRRKNVQCTNEKILIGTDEIEIVNNYRYLDLVFDCNLDIEKTIDPLVASGSCALGQILNKTRTHYDLGYGSFRKLLKSTVCAITDYCSGAWSCGADCKKLGMLMTRALRFYCGLPKTCPIAGIIGESGMIPGWLDAM